MGDFSQRGIVLRRADYGENNCMLTIFTRDNGIIKAVIYGVKRGKNNSKAASGQFLCYGDYDLFGGRGGAGSVNGVNIIDAFLPVSESVAKLALCNYMAEVVITLLGENNPDERLFNIFLNCVYALSYRDDDIMKIKTVFEIKLMCAEGLMPMLNACANCGSTDLYAFDSERGGMVCNNCRRGKSRRISTAVYKALVYLTGCPDRKMLSFNANEILLDELGRLSEEYLLEQSDRGFKSLDYFKAVKDI